MQLRLKTPSLIENDEAFCRFVSGNGQAACAFMGAAPLGIVKTMIEDDELWEIDP